MSEFIKIATKSELPDLESAAEFTVGERTICVANVNGEYCAMDNVCPHEGGPLGMGYVDGSKVVCPWHGWEFDLKTGEALFDPKLRVKTYEVSTRNGEIWVEPKRKESDSL